MKIIITIEFTKTLVTKESFTKSREECRKRVLNFAEKGAIVSQGLESTYFPPSRIHEIRIKEFE